MEIKIKCKGIGPDFAAELPDEFFDRLAAAIKAAPRPVPDLTTRESAVSPKALRREKR